jgi:hypothetical protein
MVNVYEALGRLDLMDHPVVAGQFRPLATAFVRDGKRASGTLLLHGARRKLVFDLLPMRGRESEAVLKYDVRT